MKTKRALLATPLAAIALTGCSLSGTTHQSSQAGPTDRSPAQVIQMPSGFRNFAIKCVKLQGEWFAAATTSDGGNNNNIPAGVALVPDSRCSHYGQ